MTVKKNGSGKTLTKKQRETFLAVIDRGYGTRMAADVAGASRTTFKRLIAADADFRAAYRDAQEGKKERLENEALRRAIEGVEKPIYHRGERIDTVTEFSDHLLTVLLNANIPERYRWSERGKGEQPPRGEDYEFDHLPDEELEKVVEILADAVARRRRTSALQS